MCTNLFNGCWLTLATATILVGIAGAVSEAQTADDAARQEQPSFRIGVSNPGVNFVEDMSSAYNSVHPNHIKYVLGCPNFSVLLHLIRGKWEIAVHSGPVSERMLWELKQGFPEATEFPETKIGWYAVGVVANSRIPVTSLTTAQLGDILRGNVTNWTDLGGPRREITVVGQTLNSNSGYIIQQKCFPNKSITKNLVEQKGQAGVLAKVRGTPGAIGFFLHEWKEIKGVRVLKIAPCDEAGSVTGPAVEPTHESVALELYPLTDTLVAVVHPRAPRAAHEFLDFIRTEKAAKIGEERRVLTLYHRDQVLRKQRIVSHQKGEGKLAKAVGLPSDEQVIKDLTLKHVEAQELIQIKYLKKSATSEAVRDFQSGRAELLIAEGTTDKLGEELQKSSKRILLAQSALGIIAHSQRKLTSVSLEELKQIASGEIKNWPEAEGMGPPIRGYALNATHPVMPIYFEQLVKRKMADREGTGLLLNSRIDNQQVILSVLQDPAGIGFVDLSQLPPLDGSVVLVGIATAYGKIAQPAIGLLPEGYPLVKPLTLFVSPTVSDAAKGFADWLEQNPCEDVLARHHLMPPNGIQTAKTQELLAGGKLAEPAEAIAELASVATESTPETATTSAVEADVESARMIETAAEVKSEPAVPADHPAIPTEQSIQPPADVATESIVLASVESSHRSEADAVPEALTKLLEPAMESNLPEGVIDTEASELDWTRTTLLALAVCAVTVLFAVGIRMQILRMRRKQWAKDNPLTLAE